MTDKKKITKAPARKPVLATSAAILGKSALPSKTRRNGDVKIKAEWQEPPTAQDAYRPDAGFAFSGRVSDVEVFPADNEAIKTNVALGVEAVAFFVFFAGAAGARIVAADFGAGADGLGRLGLGRASLILHFLFLALLLAFHFAGECG